MRWRGWRVSFIVASFLSPTLSWIPPAGPPSFRRHSCLDRLRTANSISRRLLSPPSPASLQLSAFLWFGGNDENKETGDNSNSSSASTSEDSATLRGVTNIIDSMASLKASQRVGERTGAVLQELSNILVEGTAADGKVKVTFNGQQVPVGVQIDETYLKSLIVKQAGPGNNKEAADQLCKALTEAMKEAQAKAATKVEDKLKSLYADLGFES